jgi:glycolate oxidase
LSREALEPAVAELRRVLPRERVLTDPGETVTYESDALTSFSVSPGAVVIPTTKAEVVEAVKICHRHGCPFVARGSGTSLSGGSLPVPDGVVIALNRLDRILAVDPVERTAVVEPGVVNSRVSAAAAEFGLEYAPDPSSQSVCSIGGNVAFNSGGAHCLRHGMTSSHVLGAEVVLPDGEIARLGGASLEGAGPDWLGLFVGSEGTFGIATELTLRLLPRAESTHTTLATYESLEAAGRAVGELVASGLLPVAIEIMDALAIEAAEASVEAGYPQDAAALLIVELEGDEDLVASEGARLEQLLAGSGALALRTARDSTERQMIWKGRKSAFSAVGWLAPDYIVQDGVVPRTRLGEALAEIDALARARGLRVANVFHAGDGNLHPLILFDGRQPGALEQAEELAGDILAMCVRMGGSITGEHGVGVEKLAYLEQMFGPDDLDYMRELRAAVDPESLANRGKMLPLERGA